LPVQIFEIAGLGNRRQMVAAKVADFTLHAAFGVNRQLHSHARMEQKLFRLPTLSIPDTGRHIR
jgi:hypothetical protein